MAMMQLDLAGTAILSASWLAMYLMQVNQNVMVTLLVGGALLSLYLQRQWRLLRLQRRIDSLDRHLVLADLIQNVTPTDTPFMQKLQGRVL